MLDLEDSVHYKAKQKEAILSLDLTVMEPGCSLGCAGRPPLPAEPRLSPF